MLRVQRNSKDYQNDGILHETIALCIPASARHPELPFECHISHFFTRDATGHSNGTRERTQWM
jgi:hypothetical protein